MTQYNSVNPKLSNSQVNILKSGIKNVTKVTLNLLLKRLTILMMRLNFCKSYYQLIDKIEDVVKLLQIMHLVMQN